MSVVLDCSVAVNWILPDEDNPAADRLLERVAVDRAVVPMLFAIEVGNALLLAVRRGRITAETRNEAFGMIGALPLQKDGFGSDHVWSTSVDLATAYGLSLYDAIYLELAKRTRLPLATLDARLAEAARKEGVAFPWEDA